MRLHALTSFAATLVVTVAAAASASLPACSASEEKQSAEKQAGENPAATNPDPTPSLADVQFNNSRVFEGMLVGGQPTRDEMARAAAAGVKTVINLRPPGEGDIDSGAIARDLGLEYVSIPVAGAADVTASAARSLDAALAAAKAPVLLHCGSGNRVGALMALRAHDVHEKSADDALAIGRATGLTSLEPIVREKLGLGVREGSGDLR